MKKVVDENNTATAQKFSDEVNEVQVDLHTASKLLGMISEYHFQYAEDKFLKDESLRNDFIYSYGDMEALIRSIWKLICNAESRLAPLTEVSPKDILSYREWLQETGKEDESAADIIDALGTDPGNDSDNYIHKLFDIFMETDSVEIAKLPQEAIAVRERSKAKYENFRISLQQLSPELFKTFLDLEEVDAEESYFNERSNFTEGFKWGMGLNNQASPFKK